MKRRSDPVEKRPNMHRIPHVHYVSSTSNRPEYLFLYVFKHNYQFSRILGKI